jgi:hypothetical protein
MSADFGACPACNGEIREVWDGLATCPCGLAITVWLVKPPPLESPEQQKEREEKARRERAAAYQARYGPKLDLAAAFERMASGMLLWIGCNGTVAALEAEGRRSHIDIPIELARAMLASGRLLRFSEGKIGEFYLLLPAGDQG